MINYYFLVFMGIFINIVYQLVYLDCLDCFYVRKSRLAVVIGILAQLFIIIVQRMFYLPEIVMYPIMILAIMFVLCRVYCINKMQAYYLSLLTNFFLLIFRGCSIVLISYMSKLTFIEVITKRDLYAIVFILSQVIMISLIFGVKRIVVNPNKFRALYFKNSRFYYLLVTYSALSCLSIVAYSLFSLNYHPILYLSVFIITALSVYLSSITFYLNSLDLTEMEALRNDSMEIERSIVKKSDHYNRFKNEIEKFKCLEHDYQNLLSVFENLMENTSSQSERSFLKGFSNEIKTLNTIKGTYSNNLVLDALLTEIESICDDNGIDFDAQIILPENPRITTFELVRIASNMLNNAIEASLKIPVEERYIKIITKSNGKWMMFKIENSFDGRIVPKDGSYSTTKKDKRSHGLGLKVVDEIVQKYDGTMTICPDRENKLFSVSIVIRNSKR